MINEKFRQLEAIGCDVAGALERMMGSDALYIKFLGKFLEDKNFEMLGLHLKEADYETAFRDAHTLKGVSANLGLNSIVSATSVIVEKLRAEVNTQGLDEDYRALEAVYHEVTDAIKLL